MNWTAERESFDQYMKRVVRTVSNSGIVIWGAGKRLYDMDQELAEQLKIVAIIDSDVEKEGTAAVVGGQEYRIENPEVLKDRYQDEIVLIFTQAYKEVAMQLKEYGVAEERYYIFMEFVSSWNWKKHHQIVLDEIDIPISNLCNLKCRDCISYVPRTLRPMNFPLEELKTSIDYFFKNVDSVKRIVIAGGETFLYPQLEQLLLYLDERYGNRFGKITLITNGLVKPNDSFAEVCGKVSFEVVISDYGTLQSRELLDEIRDRFERNGISCFIENKFGIHDGEHRWFSMGDPTTEQKLSAEELKDKYEKCTNVSRHLCQNKIMYCTPAYGGTRNMELPYEEGDVLDLENIRTDEDKLSILKYYMGYLSKGYLDMCNRCTGFGKVLNPNYVAVALQEDSGCVRDNS
ncbi:MAG: radical SAM protein [Lachnospiraceae bacterium]|nr:radical SAM protein [Lachnospiraceae bacterium]MCM1239654.1 radical SAM protein [Lachnospiraceae bacterium]